jgi:hypothetical protein
LVRMEDFLITAIFYSVEDSGSSADRLSYLLCSELF